MEIDLAMKPHGLEGPMKFDPDEPRYPMAHLEGHEPLDLPENGTITFHYKKVASREEERDGKKHYACDLELHVVLDAEADDEHPEEKSDSKKTSDALDEHARNYEKKNKKGAY